MSKADEDFKAIGFVLDTEETNIEDEIILYRKWAQILEINPKESYFYLDEPEHFKSYNMPAFSFSLYEKAKPIVEKKMKEVGWINE